MAGVGRYLLYPTTILLRRGLWRRSALGVAYAVGAVPIVRDRGGLASPAERMQTWYGVVLVPVVSGILKLQLHSWIDAKFHPRGLHRLAIVQTDYIPEMHKQCETRRCNGAMVQ